MNRGLRGPRGRAGAAGSQGSPGSSGAVVLGWTQGGSAAGASATLFSCPFAGFTGSEPARSFPMASAATMARLSVLTSAVAPATDTVFTLRKNGVDTGIVVTIPAGAAAGVFTATGSVSYAVNDLLSLKQVTLGSGGPSIVSWAVGT